MEYHPQAAWFILSGIYASGGLVYIQWNIYQWRLGLYVVEYIPAAAWFIMKYMLVAAWFIHIGVCQWRLGLYILKYASGGLVYT